MLDPEECVAENPTEVDIRTRSQFWRRRHTYLGKLYSGRAAPIAAYFLLCPS